MLVNVKDHIKQFVRHEQMSITEFEKAIGVANGYVNSISRSIGIDKLNVIVEKFPKLNLEWLLTGSGPMIKPHAGTGFTATLSPDKCILDLEERLKDKDSVITTLQNHIESLNKHIKLLNDQIDLMKQIKEDYRVQGKSPRKTGRDVVPSKLK